jgi:hypothetical protein
MLVLGSLNLRKISTPSNTMSHFLLSKITFYPTLHSSLIPMREAMRSKGTICPVSTVGRPGIQMSHTCVDCTRLPLGKLIVRGTVAGHLLSTSAPSILKIEVAPMLAMALLVAIVSALRYWGMGLPNNVWAAMAIEGRACWGAGQWCKRFDVTMVTLSSSLDDVLFMGVGSEAGS